MSYGSTPSTDSFELCPSTNIKFEAQIEGGQGFMERPLDEATLENVRYIRFSCWWCNGALGLTFFCRSWDL
jgi:hypothetical protein